MSETLWAVLLTGTLTVLATLIGGSASRTLAREERRLTVAQELRPLAVNAIEATLDAVRTARQEHDEIGNIAERMASGVDPQAHLALWDDEHPSRTAAEASQRRAERALVELELSTDDVAARKALADARLLVEALRANTIQYRVDLVSVEPVAMIGQDAWAAANQLESAAASLASALQPLTTLAVASPHGFAGWALQRRRARRLEAVQREHDAMKAALWHRDV